MHTKQIKRFIPPTIKAGPHLKLGIIREAESLFTTSLTCGIFVGKLSKGGTSLSLVIMPFPFQQTCWPHLNCVGLHVWGSLTSNTRKKRFNSSSCQNVPSFQAANLSVQYLLCICEHLFKPHILINCCYKKRCTQKFIQ